MPKSERSEAETWALAYAVAAAFLTLGSSSKHGFAYAHSDFAEYVDDRAAAIADRVAARLKEKKVL